MNSNNKESPKKKRTYKKREPKKKEKKEEPKKKRTYKKRQTKTETKESKPKRTYKIKEKIEKKSPKKKTCKKTNLEETQTVIIKMKKKCCDKSIASNSLRLNEKYADLMDDLAYIMRKNKDFMRARAYNNAKETIVSYKSNIVDPEQLKGKPGIGNTIFDKLVEFKETGSLSILRKQEKLLKQRKAISVFMDIYGVGEKKAEDLVEKGVLTIADLEKRKEELLNDKQQIGLKYYKDILERIPRSEIIDYEGIFRENFPKEDGKMEIVGSYRRGASNSGDIDAIITSKDSNVFKQFVDNLLEKNIIVEVLSRGPTKCLVITKLPGYVTARRVDFLYSTPEEYPFATLYFTGSKEFNTNMRETCFKNGFNFK